MNRPLLVMFVLAAVPAPVRGQASLEATVDPLVAATLERSGIPGIAVAITSEDSVLLLKGYGKVSSHSPNPVRVDTRFEIGSVTKTITAAALAVLVADGEVNWDDRLASVLDEFSIADALVMERLTIRDILSMRSGFSTGDAAYGSAEDPAEVLRMVASFEAPGFRTRGGYTANLNYFLAGQIIEAVSGESWEAVVQERVLTPLGMVHTRLRSSESDHQRADGHRLTEQGPLVVPPTAAGAYASAGGLESSAGDLARWVQWLLSYQQGVGEDTAAGHALQEMWVPQAIAPPRWIERFNPEAKFLAQGMPWLLSHYRGVTLIEVPGGTSGFRSIVTLIPEEGLGLAILMNASATFGPLRDLKLEIVNALLASRVAGIRR